jgi:DNA mismatch repair protein MutL
VPRILAGSDYLRTLRDLVAELQGLGSRGTFRDAVEELLATIACHSVVRGRHSLTPPEIRELLAALDRIDFAGHCPHGRPVSRTISLGEVEKMFKR